MISAGWEKSISSCAETFFSISNQKFEIAATHKMVKALAPDGYLLLGAQDAVADFSLPLAVLPQERGIFAKTKARAVARALA